MSVLIWDSLRDNTNQAKSTAAAASHDAATAWRERIKRELPLKSWALAIALKCGSGKARVALARKLSVINETARALSDIIDAERSVRLEMIIVALIVVEILVTLYDLFVRAAK